MEEWKHIAMFERYEVSNTGNIRRGNKLLAAGLDTDGYRQVNLYSGGKRYIKRVYRLVMEAFNPNVESKPQIDHINRIRTDDRLENLRWATASENVRNSKHFTEEMLGISFSKKNSTYMVRLRIGDTERYYGSRKTLEEAKKLRDDVLNGTVDFTPRSQRESYGISLLSRGFYQVRVNGKTVGYKKTFDEAKDLRDKCRLVDNHEGREL
jgi:hypothetical protein